MSRPQIPNDGTYSEYGGTRQPVPVSVEHIQYAMVSNGALYPGVPTYMNNCVLPNPQLQGPSHSTVGTLPYPIGTSPYQIEQGLVQQGVVKQEFAYNPGDQTTRYQTAQQTASLVSVDVQRAFFEGALNLVNQNVQKNALVEASTSLSTVTDQLIDESDLGKGNETSPPASSFGHETPSGMSENAEFLWKQLNNTWLGFLLRQYDLMSDALVAALVPLWTGGRALPQYLDTTKKQSEALGKTQVSLGSPSWGQPSSPMYTMLSNSGTFKNDLQNRCQQFGRSLLTISHPSNPEHFASTIPKEMGDLLVNIFRAGRAQIWATENKDLPKGELLEKLESDLFWLERLGLALRRYSSGTAPHIKPENLLSRKQVKQMWKSIILHCEKLEKHGLVDYERGLSEESITDIAIQCLNHPYFDMMGDKEIFDAADAIP